MMPLLAAWLLAGLWTQAPVVTTGQFHYCAVTGSTQITRIQALNRLKNRAMAPATIDATVTAETLMSGSASNDAGATIRLYVTNVKVGGIESVNCKATAPQWRDTHIEGNAEGPDYIGQPLIVEVTPRWRMAMATIGEDWSTVALKQTLIGHWVDFTGWVFIDSEHTQNAVSTNPQGTHLWRQTVNEIHPVTAIRVIEN